MKRASTQEQAVEEEEEALHSLTLFYSRSMLLLLLTLSHSIQMCRAFIIIIRII